MIVVTFKARSALIVLSHVTLPGGSVRERCLKLGNGKRDARHRSAPLQYQFMAFQHKVLRSFYPTNTEVILNEPAITLSLKNATFSLGSRSAITYKRGK